MEHSEARGPLDPAYGAGLGVAQDLGVHEVGVLQSLDKVGPPTIARDFAIAAGSHPMHGLLSPRAGPVKTATPLTLASDGYVIAAPGEPFDMICATSPIGDQIHGFAIATVETYKKQFRMGDKYRIDYIGPDGQIYLIDDATGPMKALSDTQFLMRAMG